MSVLQVMVAEDSAIVPAPTPEITGGTGLFTVTETLLLAPVIPAALHATAASVCGPLARPAVFHFPRNTVRRSRSGNRGSKIRSVEFELHARHRHGAGGVGGDCNCSQYGRACLRHGHGNCRWSSVGGDQEGGRFLHGSERGGDDEPAAQVAVGRESESASRRAARNGEGRGNVLPGIGGREAD